MEAKPRIVSMEEHTARDARAPSRHVAISNPVVLATMCIGVLVAQLDTSVVNLALKHIGAGLGVDVTGLQWIVDGYNLAYATLLLTGGVLGDRYGHRRLFVIGLAVFTGGSLVCGLASQASMLIFGRAVTGMGAAFLLPSSLAILSATYAPGPERARAIGIWAGCNGVAFAVGPTLGGWMVEGFGWRSVFLLIVPVGLVGAIMALRSVPEVPRAEGRRLAPFGQGAAALALGSATIGLIESTHWGWTSAATIVCFAVALGAGALFLRSETRSEHPLVPPVLFRGPVFGAALAAAATMTFGMYAMLFLVPLYLQGIRGMGPVPAGAALLPMSVVFALVSSRSGQIATAFGPRSAMAAGLGLIGVGLLLLTSIDSHSSLWLFEGAMVLIGVGLGLNTGPVMTVAVGSAPRTYAGIAAGLVNTARMVGATLGIAILGALFASYAGQDVGADVNQTIAGMRAAFIAGGCGELVGAFIAFRFIDADSLAPAR